MRFKGQIPGFTKSGGEPILYEAMRHLEAGGHVAVHIIPSLNHHWQCVLANKF
jgi:hypothetical protein